MGKPVSVTVGKYTFSVYNVFPNSYSKCAPEEHFVQVDYFSEGEKFFFESPLELMMGDSSKSSLPHPFTHWESMHLLSAYQPMAQKLKQHFVCTVQKVNAEKGGNDSKAPATSRRPHCLPALDDLWPQSNLRLLCFWPSSSINKHNKAMLPTWWQKLLSITVISRHTIRTWQIAYKKKVFWKSVHVFVPFSPIQVFTSIWASHLHLFLNTN